MLNYFFTHVFGCIECIPEQPVGIKCPLIEITVYLIPSNSTVPISTDDRELVINKVIDALNGATGEYGEIYNELACPLYPSNQPSSETSRPQSILPSIKPTVSAQPSVIPSVSQGKFVFIRIDTYFSCLQVSFHSFIYLFFIFILFY